MHEKDFFKLESQPNIALRVTYNMDKNRIPLEIVVSLLYK